MFKVGDKVVCVNNTDNEGILTIGKTYIVRDYNQKYEYCRLEGVDLDWFTSRFKLESEIVDNTTPTEVDPLVEIRQSEYDEMVEQINLLSDLLVEANIKLAGLESKEFKPVTEEYTMEDWEQARDEKWVFELNSGTEVFVRGIMDEFNDSQHPVELSSVGEDLHECTVTLKGQMWCDGRFSERSIKCRIK